MISEYWGIPGFVLASSVLYLYCLSSSPTALKVLLMLLTLEVSYLLLWSLNAYLICQFQCSIGTSIEGILLFLSLYFPTCKGYLPSFSHKNQGVILDFSLSFILIHPAQQVPWIQSKNIPTVQSLLFISKQPSFLSLCSSFPNDLFAIHSLHSW